MQLSSHDSVMLNILHLSLLLLSISYLSANSIITKCKTYSMEQYGYTHYPSTSVCHFPHLWVEFWIGDSNCLNPSILAPRALLSTSVLTYSIVCMVSMAHLAIIFISNNPFGFQFSSVYSRVHITVYFRKFGSLFFYLHLMYMFLILS